LNCNACSADGDRGIAFVPGAVVALAGDVVGAPSSGGAAAAGAAALGVVEALSPLFDCDAKYGTPIDAPTSEAIMSGFEAMARLQLEFPVILFDIAALTASILHENGRL
jgi:hypothetical protein